jgi:plasmid stability protein
MATLHVRNVPDDLYELLRERSEENGRSIGAEVVQLLEQALAPRRMRPFSGRHRRRSGSASAARFTGTARATVVDAQEEARALGCDHIGTDHLLLGVLGRGDEVPAVRALGGLGITYDGVREQAARGDAEPGPQIPLGPESKEALEIALREALKLRHNVIAPVHVVLGIVGQGTGAGALIIRAAQPDPDKVRSCLLRETGIAGGLEFIKPFCVVELAGTAAEWENQLNAVAGGGYELVEIVDKRAVFRCVTPE